MLNNKSCFLIFTILIVLLFGMAIVSATDNGNTTITDTDTVSSAADVTTDNNILEVKEKINTCDNNDANSFSAVKSVEKQDSTNKDTKKAATSTLTDNNELVNAVETANESRDEVYIISLLQGDYSLTTGNCIQGYVTTTESCLTFNKITTMIELDPIIEINNSEVPINGELSDINNNKLSNQNITLIIDGIGHNVVTDNNGFFKYTHLFGNRGNKTIIVKFAGTDIYNASNNTIKVAIEHVSTNITLNDISDHQYSDKFEITGTFRRCTGEPIPNATIYLIINGVSYHNKTDVDGYFEYNYLASKVGTIGVVATFGGNSVYGSSSDGGSFVVSKKDTVVVLDDVPDVQYSDRIVVTGRLIKVTGEGIVNATVYLSINGVNYHVKTDVNGYYSYLYTANKVGLNNITARFNGNSVYNYDDISNSFIVVKQD